MVAERTIGSAGNLRRDFSNWDYRRFAGCRVRIMPPASFSLPILENVVELSAILFRDFFLGLVFPARLGFLSTPQNPGGRLRCTFLIEQPGNIAPEEPGQERENPNNDRNENEEKQASQPARFFAFFLRHWGLVYAGTVSRASYVWPSPFPLTQGEG
jgi:hypothetical protein